MELNEKQTITTKKIYEFISQNVHKEFYFFGYAGTGKTFTISKIIKDIVDKNIFSKIYICTPTHQALNIIQSYVKDTIEISNNIMFATIHKLFNFRPVIAVENGDKIFMADSKENTFFSKNNKYIVIIDECSMISSDMVVEIKKNIKLHEIKIIYLGDLQQLPPVSEPESLIFSLVPEKYNYTVCLDEIMRTKSDVIKILSNEIRKWNKKTSISTILSDIYNEHKKQTKKLRIYHNNENHITTRWFANFINSLKTKTPIILTWRNKTSDNYNNIVRKHIHKEKFSDTFLINDNIIFCDYYCCSEKTPFYTSDMAVIKEIKTGQINFNMWNKYIEDVPTEHNKLYNRFLNVFSKLTQEFQVDTLKIKSKRYSIDVDILIINANCIIQYTQFVETIKSKIILFYKKTKNEYLTKQLWKIFYNHVIEKYAHINFGYSITVHKAQGSTFDSVYIDITDINANQDINEMHRMLYTAITRASDELAIIA